MSSLADALSALDRDDRAAALDHLLAVWRAAPNKRAAAAIEALSASITKSLPAIGGADGDALHLAWMEVAKEGRAIDVGRLVGALLEAPAGSLDARVDQLVARAADPRVVKAFGAMILAPPTTASSRFPMWTAIAKYLEKAQDAAARAPIEKWLAQKDAGTSNFYPKQRARLEKLLEKLPEAAPIKKEDKAAYDALDAKIAALAPMKAIAAPPPKAKKGDGDGEALLRAVYERPDDMQARLVYADFLTERGDPRGEFIVLQCRDDEGNNEYSGAGGNAAKKIFKLHVKEWLGDLGKVIEAPEIWHFRRGFLKRINPRLRTAAQVKLATALRDDPRWSTVQIVNGSLGALVGPAFKSLREANGQWMTDLAALAELDAPLPIEKVTVRYGNDRAAVQPQIDRIVRAKGSTLSRLKELWVTVQDDTDYPFEESRWLAEAKCTESVEVLRLDRDRLGQPWFVVEKREKENPAYHGFRTTEWRALFDARPKLRSLSLFGELFQPRIERDGAELRYRVAIYGNPSWLDAPRSARIVAWLRTLGAGARVDLEVEKGSNANADAAKNQLVEEAQRVGLADLQIRPLVR